MNYSIVLYILGCVLKFESAFLVLPALVGLIYREHASVSYLAVAVLFIVLLLTAASHSCPFSHLQITFL